MLVSHISDVSFQEQDMQRSNNFFTHFAVDNIYGLLFFLFERALLACAAVQ